MHEDIERKLSQALQLISEASAMLAESKRGQAPAQVMSRIQAAGAGTRPPLQMVVRKPQQALRKERAHFYLRIAAASDPTNDKIYRVVGDAGLTEANRMQSELGTDPTYLVERLNSRQYSALTLSRLQAIREGATGFVGATTAEDLRGPGVQS